MLRRTIIAGAAVFASLVAGTSAALTCGDSAYPTLGDGLNNAGFIPAGPALIATGAQGYTYAVNTATDDLEFYVQTAPGVGSSSSFTRKMYIALTSDATLTYPGSPGACQITWDQFALGSVPAGVTVTKDTNLTNAVGTGAESTCVFNHKWAQPWEDFRNASKLNNCGFTISTNTSALGNGTYRTYHGKVHVKWEDYNATALVRPAQSTWYDVTIQVQDSANYTGNSTTNTETPYNADFQVTGVVYAKDNAGVVTSEVSYQLTTNFPYYGKMPASGLPYDFLIHTGSSAPTGLSYATKPLGAFPSAAFTHSYTQAGGQNLDGTRTSDGSACDAPGKICVQAGKLIYTWKPTDGSSPNSCSISAPSPYQFDFVLGCNTNYNGTIASTCDQPMRQALDLANFGSWSLSGNIDFCKSAATDFPITWTKNFDVASTTRQIGQPIEASGTFTTNKALAAVAIKSFSVARTDLTGAWELWNPATDEKTASAAAGAASTMGTRVNMQTSITKDGAAKAWAIASSFVPNIELRTALVTPSTAFDSVGERGTYMISMPNDKNQALSYQITIVLRMYSDATQTFQNTRRRRLMFRDVKPQAVNASASFQEATLKASPVKIQVPDSVSVGADGSVTVPQASTSQGLSAGAIAGIAVGATVGAAALIAGTVLLVRKNNRQKAADAEAQASTLAADYKGVPSYSSGSTISAGAVPATAVGVTTEDAMDAGCEPGWCEKHQKTHKHHHSAKKTTTN